ncbi:MarR family winged helix-turn-helix transcriptional regulator [Alicyclobacillus fodiniaquatilis]|uniref:MarR family winged helix-turn-helix transcriptional regulator n=1 Tax=Alicyclobacillus fodiniaquatilis TaxID=1661150 RepID=A0ABW4JKX3_9BACL
MTSVIDDAVYIRKVVKNLNKLIDQTWEVEAQKSGLTRAQVNVFQALYHLPGVSLKDLSARLGMAHSTVSGIIDRLEKKGYVERRADAADKRFSRLYLSEAVDAYVTRELPASLDAPLIAALSQLKDEEREQIKVGLEMLEKAVRVTQ